MGFSGDRHSIMANTVSASATTMASLPPAYAETMMATAPTASGTMGTRIRPEPKALVSSQAASTMATASTATNAAFHRYRDSRTTAPSASPTPIAAGRLRPARVRRSGGGTACIGTGSSGELPSSGSVVMG